ncbi:rod shape-determining protein MreD [Ammonifex degensii KC4]|uniref:Rod shape-determining protein MreD n=1 Tax=Ammonifex degensii (strain DSM 10501 / KC4) TaxID=429009 RepID=C9R8K4_AMMDK|nr:rod shape-determining protein MreD [Ammonifex degensii]ACX52633.1 rod shape-determining protein MreD [Ammonifex degensii KC4]
MQTFILLLLIGFSLLLQTTVLTYLRVAGVRPDLLLILAAFIGFWRGPREGGLWGAVAGLICDLVTGGFVGLNALTKLLAGYLAGQAGAFFYRESSLTCALVTGSVTLVAELVTYLLLLFLGIRLPFKSTFVYLILPVTAYNAIAAVVLFHLWQRLLPRRFKVR